MTTSKLDMFHAELDCQKVANSTRPNFEKSKDEISKLARKVKPQTSKVTSQTSKVKKTEIQEGVSRFCP